MAPLMSTNVPVALAEDAHCQVSLVTPPSGSVRLAATAVPTCGLDGSSFTVPASSSLVTVIVTAMVASTEGSSVLSMALPSLTLTVTEYSLSVSKSSSAFVRNWPVAASMSNDAASLPPSV